MFFLVFNRNRNDICRGKSGGNIFGGVFAVADDIDFLSAEKVNDLVDSCASLTDTCADGINIFVCAVNGNLAS